VATEHADPAVCPHITIANSVYKWSEKSDTCPQCRAKLSTTEPFVRDYLLERIAEKYARTLLTTEEVLEREVQATYTLFKT
jgi:hypothetical protein